MTEGLSEAIQSALTGNQEHFNANTNNYLSTKAIAKFIVFIIYLVILLLVGKFLWNEVLCKLVSVVKPASSVWQILGVAILLRFIYT